MTAPDDLTANKPDQLWRQVMFEAPPEGVLVWLCCDDSTGVTLGYRSGRELNRTTRPWRVEDCYFDHLADSRLMGTVSYWKPFVLPDPPK